jgi:hypothetical protein
MSESETKKPSADTDADDDDVQAELERVAEDPPKDLEDWPGGKAKYRTLGGGEHEEGYGEGPTAKLGPADLVHHEDGSVSVEGEKVDNPEDYKGDPIPGGPTDPDAKPDPGFDADKGDDEDRDDADGDDADRDDEDKGD